MVAHISSCHTAYRPLLLLLLLLRYDNSHFALEGGEKTEGHFAAAAGVVVPIAGRFRLARSDSSFQLPPGAILFLSLLQFAKFTARNTATVCCSRGNGDPVPARHRRRPFLPLPLLLQRTLIKKPSGQFFVMEEGHKVSQAEKRDEEDEEASSSSSSQPPADCKMKSGTKNGRYHQERERTMRGLLFHIKSFFNKPF